MPRKVKGTDHVFFDEHFKTFRLTAGDSLYAFCISPELTLEHLYWGQKLPDNYDLRYLSQSYDRMAHFNTVEAPAHNFDGRIVLEAETLEEIQKTWRLNKKKPSPTNNEEVINRRRIENYSWRIMSKMAISTPTPTPTRRRSVDMSSGSGEQDPAERPCLATRGRSVSLPAGAGTPISRDSDSHTLSAPPPSPIQRLGRSHPNKQTFDRTLGKIGKGMLCVEYTDHGTGDFRSPSFLAVDQASGSSISPLRYRHHVIYAGKLTLEGMPSVRCLDDGEASTLVVTLADAHSGLEVDLVYVAMHAYDCITRRAVFRSESSKVIQKACSCTLDVEYSSAAFHSVQTNGAWARENYISETLLGQGCHSYGSTRGVSSHHHNPFLAITQGAPSEVHGEVMGFALVYSGNFLVEAEVNEMGRLRVNMGIHPMGLQWQLQGQPFRTPEVVLVRSSEGLGGMSRALHRLVLDRLIPRHWSDEAPPVLLNSWEGKYFHVNHENILQMAGEAAKVGIDLLVLDDGWFGQRNDDKTSLGDWVVDVSKFPQGIKHLADEVNKLGLRFGLWFEPEMVSEQSALFTAHPDWAFHVPGRPRQIGRNQMVLDLSREDVRDYIYTSLAAVLSNANIEYVKWDMNRPLTEVYSILAATSCEVQAGLAHRYVLGVYNLQQRITAAFPHILFENCASGGGRFDLGMLYYSPQIWASDNTDALVRMRIQYGTSLAYPARCMGAHVSTVPNHVTGNTTRLRTRGFVAMCGTFGYELDLSLASDKDKAIFRQQIDFYRLISPIVRWGDLFRLWNPFKMALAAWMYVSRDKTKAVVFVFSANSDHWSNLVPRLLLQGLSPDAEYEVQEPYPNNLTQAAGNMMLIESSGPVYQLGVASAVMTGQILMKAGLPIKFYTLDDSAVFVLTQRSVRGAGLSSTTQSPLQTPRGRGLTTSGSLTSISEDPVAGGRICRPHSLQI